MKKISEVPGVIRRKKWIDGQSLRTKSAEGYVLKSKSLEDVSKSSCKMEARLIGFDETPIDVVDPGLTDFGNLKVTEPFGGSIKPLLSAAPIDIEAPTSGGSHNRTARSHLYEICAANCWKPPLLECCAEEGPSHLKLLTYKAVLESQDIVLECYSTPQAKKKTAAEQAAE